MKAEQCFQHKLIVADWRHLSLVDRYPVAVNSKHCTRTQNNLFCINTAL